MIVSRSAGRGEATRDAVRRLGSPCEFVAADVSRPAEVEGAVRSAVERFGRLDVAVNNAGDLGAGAFKETAAIDESEFDQSMAVNLRSVWACMKYEIRQMLSQDGGGAIVNVSSVNGLGGVPHNALYAAAKAGVLALTKSAALEYAARGIRINAVVPGGFKTPMLEGVFAQIGPADPGAVETSYAAMVPAQRIGNPDEAAAAIVWLASADASYVIGHSLIVDGGLTAPYR
jgi:NAD(P)-dependent dehydrogenase (short-subunit alcohol dehydrogenase family)